MHERLGRPDPLIQLEESVKEWLRDIRERSENPNLLDRITLPAKRYVTSNLVRILDMPPEEIAEIRDAE